MKSFYETSTNFPENTNCKHNSLLQVDPDSEAPQGPDREAVPGEVAQPPQPRHQEGELVYDCLGLLLISDHNN